MTLQSSAPFDVLGQLTALRRYARSLTRSDVDAEDLVHDALVRAYEKRASFQSGRNLRAWLLSILHNVFIDGRRARQAETQRIARAAELLNRTLASNVSALASVAPSNVKKLSRKRWSWMR